MPRVVVSLWIAAGLGIAAVVAAACTGGGDTGKESVTPAPDTGEQSAAPAPRQQPAVYLSLGDSSIQDGCFGESCRPSGSLFRQYLAQRLNRPVEWIALVGSQTTDEFIDGLGGEASQLDRAVDALAAWRREGRDVVAITLSIGGSDLVEVGTECHALGKQSCPDIYGEALTNYVEQLSLILRRLNQAKDPHTPLLVLTYYNASDCGQTGVEFSPEELGVQGWNQAIIGAAGANGAFLADIFTPFQGNACEYTSNLRATFEGHAAIAKVYKEVYESLSPDLVELFKKPRSPRHLFDFQCLGQARTELVQNATPAAPERVAELTSILCGDPTVKAILAGRKLGSDYWIGISYVYEHADVGNKGEEPFAMVDFFFDPPVSYAGEVAAIVADPCRGHGVEGRLDPNDPCVDEPKEYGSEYREFIDAQHVTAEIDFRRGEVVEVFQSPVAWETIDYFRMQYEQ